MDLEGLGWDGRTGGAVDSLCDDLLVAAPWGDFALVRPHGTVSYLDGNVPMSEAGRLEGDPHFERLVVRPDRFRVADVLLKPRSAERWELFVTHSYFTGECLRFRLSSTAILLAEGRVTISPSWRTIFDADPSGPCVMSSAARGGHMAGGKILTDGRDHLLVVVGDHGRPGLLPQAGDSHLGKLVRIEIATGDTEVLAFGLRNPQGLARDRNGDLWETEHGPQGGDELNLLEPGGNYGWPAVTYGVGYGGRVNVRRAAETGRHDGFVRPVFSWVPSIGVSAVVVNDDRAFPLWRDDLLVASLSGESIFRVRRHRRIVQYVERIEFGSGIRDLAQMPDGRIAVLSAHGGRLWFLSRSDAYCDGRSLRLRRVWSVGCDSTDDHGAAGP